MGRKRDGIDPHSFEVVDGVAFYVNAALRVNSPPALDSLGTSRLGTFLMLGGAMAWGASTVIVRGVNWSLSPLVLGGWQSVIGAGPLIVGSPCEVADQLQEWVHETDVDGFNLAYAITPGTFEDVVHYIVPELQQRGIYRTEYTPGTLRHKLFGKGDRLPEEHRAQQIVRGVRSRRAQA